MNDALGIITLRRALCRTAQARSGGEHLAGVHQPVGIEQGFDLPHQRKLAGVGIALLGGEGAADLLEPGIDQRHMNMRAGRMPEPEEDGKVYLKVPVDLL